MSPPVASASLDLKYPLWASDFDPLNNNFLIVGGGGGESRTGLGNKITISEVVDIDLSRDEDSVTSLAIASSTATSVTAFAGINSSEKDQNAGKNEHLRSFRLEYPPQRKASSDNSNDTAFQAHKGQTAPLGRASLFMPSTAVRKETFQRITRLSRPSKINGGQLGAIATGLAPEGEIVLFDAKTNGPMGPWVEARLPLGKGVQAEDVDIIELNDSDNSPLGAFAVAYCTDYEVHVCRLTLKQNPNPELQFAYGEPHPDVFAGKARPKFRSLRFITPHLLLLLQNRPNRQGADLLLLELSSTFQGRILGRKTLHRGINAATALSVTHLSSPSSSESSQLVAAVAGQDNSVSIFTLEHANNALFRSLKFKRHILLSSVHSQTITSLSFTTFSPPVATASSAPPLYIKLASTSIGHTVVVHTLPLMLYPPPSQKSSSRRYVLTSPGRSDAATMTLSILISALAIAFGAFILQVFTEVRGGTPEYLGAKGWLSQRLHDYIAIPNILTNGTSIAPFTTANSLSDQVSLTSSSISEHITNTLTDVKSSASDFTDAASSVSSSISEKVTDTFTDVKGSASDFASTAKEILYDSPEEARAAVHSALDAASSAASELNAASEAYSATASLSVSSLSSSATAEASTGHHHIRDLLSRHHRHRRHESSSAIPHMVIHDDEENGKLKAGFHHPGKVDGKEAKRFEDLTKTEKEMWKKRLRDAGVWTVAEGESVLKGVFFGSIAGAVGNAVRGAMARG
ncbi:MAG: hypothetical protein Q9186_000335 [Xanthomendoza sp. 1 TL-2023]